MEDSRAQTAFYIGLRGGDFNTLDAEPFYRLVEVFGESTITIVKRILVSPCDARSQQTHTAEKGRGSGHEEIAGNDSP
jgi:hypothetical protein